MRPRFSLALVAALCVFVRALLIGQVGAQTPPAATPPAAPALKETVAPEIPGVISGGTKIVLLRDGFMGTEGVISMPDGSMFGAPPQSVGFAGPNKRTLYIVGGGALYKTQTEMVSQGIQTRAK